MNQLLRLQLVKYTQRENKTCFKKTKKNQHRPPCPRKKDPYNTPDGGSYDNSQGTEAINCWRKDLHPRGCRYPRFFSFLCKCNLTKS